MSRRTLLLPTAAFIVVWSSGYIAGPYGVQQMAPFSMVAWRFIFAAGLTIILARLTRGPLRASRETLGRLAATGLMLNGVQFAAMYLAFSVGLPATLAALLHSLSPLLTACLAAIFLRERLAPIQLVGFAIGVVGVLVVLGPKIDAVGGPIGLTAALISTVALSLGTLGQRWSDSGTVDPVWAAAIQFTGAAPPLFIFALVTEGTNVIYHPIPAAAALAYLVLINSIVGLLLLGVLVRRGSAGTAASSFFMMPAVTAILAWLVLDEQLGVREVIGLVIAVTGVAAATVFQGTRRSRAENSGNPAISLPDGRPLGAQSPGGPPVSDQFPDGSAFGVQPPGQWGAFGSGTESGQDEDSRKDGDFQNDEDA